MAPILLHHSLAVEQSEAAAFTLAHLFSVGKSANLLAGNHAFGVDQFHILLTHTDAAICHRYLYITVTFLSTDIDGTTLRGEFAGIVHQRVNHKQSECTVSLHHSLGRLDDECYAFPGVQAYALAENLKQRFYGKTLQTQLDSAPLDLNPCRKHIVVLTYLMNQFVNILQFEFEYFPGFVFTLDERIHLPDSTVEERSYGIDNREACGTVDITAFEIVKTDELHLVLLNNILLPLLHRKEILIGLSLPLTHGLCNQSPLTHIVEIVFPT